MKKNLNYKLLVTSVCVILALLFLLVLTVNSANPTITYAYSENEEVYYASLGNSRKETESFTYTTKTVDSYLINPSFPNYYNNNGNLQNTCANVAGANIIGYYDSKYTNLIPSYDPEIIRGKREVFKSVSSDTQNVINDLYVRMNTNTTGAGVTHNQFQNGLMSYISAAGYSATVGEAVSSGQINVNTIKNNIENGIPMICFCTMS